MLKNITKQEIRVEPIQTRSVHGSESQGLRDISILELIIYLGQRTYFVFYKMENKRVPTWKQATHKPWLLENRADTEI